MSEIARSERSEKILTDLSVPINPALPEIEDEVNAEIQPAEDIAKRILVLGYLAMLADSQGNVDPEEIIEFFKEIAIWDAVSPIEKELLQKPVLTKQECIELSWRAEGIYLLCWSLGYFQTLGLPTRLCEVDQLIAVLPPFFLSPEKFISRAKVRPINEILDQSDLIYRIHWAVRDAQIKGLPIPANFIPGVVAEWHYAINWLTCQEMEWDFVTTDT
jgi:hypothetical protein